MSKSERKRRETRKYYMKSWLVRVFEPNKIGYHTLKSEIKTRVTSEGTFEDRDRRNEVALRKALKIRGYKPVQFHHRIAFVDVERVKKK